MTHRTRTLASVLGVLALLCTALAATGGTASAQNAPFSAYGSGLEPGAEVEAFISGRSCGTTEVTTAGEWILRILPTHPCRPSNGATITFRVDGVVAQGSTVFEIGGAPDDIANGITLTVTEPGNPDAFSGDINPGINLVVFVLGGPIESAASAAPNATAFYVSVSGRLVGYIVGAPAFVNTRFFQQFDAGVLSAGTLMIVIAG